MNFFDKSLKLSGFKIDFAKAKLKRIQSTRGDTFKKYVEDRKQFILTHHFMYNAFYKKWIGTDQVPDWEDIPIMKKSDLQQPIEKRLAEGYLKKDVYVGKTSGSSGHPFVFAKCKASHALSWASFYDRYSWYGIDLSRSKQARFYGIPLHFVGYAKERFKDWLGNRYRFPIFDLSEGKLSQVLEKFKKTPFHYINGYTSSIVLFAKYLKEHNYHLKEICPSLKGCIVTSEMLFDDDRALLESQFGIPVINEYGASETGLIAFENKDKKLQVDSELLFVEILDEKGNTVPLGTVGRIIITSFYNKAHPVIRYEIGDIGALSKESTWRVPILEKLQGRTSDIARLPSGKVVPGLTFYYVTKTLIQEDNNVTEFVIEQTTEHSFVFTYVSKEELTSQEEEKIKKVTSAYLEAGLDLDFKRVPVLQRSANGKLKQFTSRV